MGRKEFDVSELDIIDYRKCGAMAIFKPLFEEMYRRSRSTIRR